MNTATRMTTATGRRLFIAGGCLYEAFKFKGSTPEDLAIYCGDEFAQAKPKVHIVSSPKTSTRPGESCMEAWNRFLAECE